MIHKKLFLYIIKEILMKCFLIGNYRNVMAKKRIHVIKNLFFNYYLIRLFRTACSRLLQKNKRRNSAF